MPSQLLTRIRMTKNHLGHPEGKRLEVDLDTAREWCDAGAAEPDNSPIVPDETELKNAADKARKDAIDAMSDEIDKRAKALFDEEIDKMKKTPGKDGTGDSDADSKMAKVTRVHEKLRDDPKLGFKSFGHFASEIYRSGEGGRPVLSEGLKIARAMSEEMLFGVKAVGSDELQTGSDTYGGFLVPTEFVQNLLQIPHDAPSLIGRARAVPMATDSIEIPAVDETSLAQGSLFGGVSVQFRAETEQMTGTRPTFRRIGMQLNELAVLVYVTERLLKKSAVSIDLFLNQAMPEAIRWKLDDTILRGTGAGQPLGILNSNALVTVAKESSQPADTIRPFNLAKMYSRMYAPYRNNAVWIYNQDIEAELFMMLAGQVATAEFAGTPVFLPPGGLSSSPFAMILGRPAIPFPHCSTIGDLGDILFVDMNQYLLGRESGSEFESATSMHLRFDYAQVAFRVQMMVDGQPWWTSALTPAQGSNTQSPFVTLAARA